MKIFVIGAHKTGTTSMCAALEVLGFRTSHFLHYEELMVMIKAGRFDFPMLEEYDAVGDLPIPVAYRELDEHYPDSRFILTVRDTDRWIKSLENRRWWKDRERPIELDEVEQMFYGFTHFDRDACKAVYDAHNEAVRAYFSGRDADLLEFAMDGGADWPALCAFLNRPVPSVPFPHSNRHQAAHEASGVAALKKVVDKVGLGRPLRAIKARLHDSE